MQNAAVDNRMLRSVPHISNDVTAPIVLPVRRQTSAKKAIESVEVIVIATARIRGAGNRQVQARNPPNHNIAMPVRNLRWMHQFPVFPRFQPGNEEPVMSTEVKDLLRLTERKETTGAVTESAGLGFDWLV